jgi:hypothetical protein
MAHGNLPEAWQARPNVLPVTLFGARRVFNEAGMRGQFNRTKLRFLPVLLALSIGSCAAFAQTAPKEETSAKAQSQVASDALKKIDQLVRQNEQLEKQNHELIDQINSLRQLLAPQTSVPSISSSG